MRPSGTRAGVAAMVAILMGAVAWGFVSNRRRGIVEVAPAARIVRRNGRTFVVLDSMARRRGGVALAAVSALRQPTGISAYGRVMQLDGLTRGRDQYAQAEAAAAQASARLDQARAAYGRLALLHADSEIVSSSSLEAARATYQADSAARMATSRALRSARAALRENFGPVIGGWLAHDPPVLDSLLRGQRVLLQVTLFPPLVLGAPPERAVAVLPSGKTIPARFVSWAAETDPEIQGQSFFCLAPSAPALLPGASVEVRIRPRSGREHGVLVPRSAVVWYEGSPWVYALSRPNELARRRIRIDGRTGDAYAVEGVEPGARIVVRGAGLVLSEETLSSMPAEDD